MNVKKQVYRFLYHQLPASSSRRIVIITGARQTGKTTISRKRYADLRYINLDAPENRERLNELPTFTWADTVGAAVIDEAQKAPAIFEKVKYNFDDGAIRFTVLTGSSQILLLKKIRESLAGRAFFYELWPLMQSEIKVPDTRPPAAVPLISELLAAKDFKKVLLKVPPMPLAEHDHACRQAEDYILKWGGMPALLQLSESDRWKWLKDYGYTYLERDLADLARLDDLSPFRKFQKLSALRSANLLNYSELARDAAISVDTARRYMEYLNVSYQTFLLQPYDQNLTSSVVKTPKIYWADIGIWRRLTGFKGELTGEMYETMVVSELMKWIKTTQSDTEMYFYRTRSGSELDLLLETPAGLIGMEIKSRRVVAQKDTSVMKKVARSLGNRWKGGVVVYLGDEIKQIAAPDIWAIPSRHLFQSPTP